MSNIYLGYDPGGGGAHGVAAIVANEAHCDTLATAEDAIRWFKERCGGGSPKAIGVDTLTLWSTGPSGWRPADHALRAAYPRVVSSITAPNSLYGAMPVGGAAVALALRGIFPELKITETHPKVLYFCLTQAPYDFVNSRDEMIHYLAQWTGSKCTVGSEHGWDALVSAYAAREWDDGRWTHDLHALPARPREQLIPAHGSQPHYAWPVPVNEALERPPKAQSSKRSQGQRDRWKIAVERLQDAGHDDVAQSVRDYRNARGERSGWDSWLKSSFPKLWPVVEHGE